MKFFVACGSQRPHSQSIKISNFIINSITKLSSSNQHYLLDLAANPLPFWNEGVWSDSPEWKKAWHPIKEELKSSDALIVVSPEWAGMATPAIRNFLLLCAGGPISHKPGLIVTVSGSRNGAYPVAELRATTTKNNHLVWIPEHIIVRDAEKVLNPGEPTSEDDRYLRNRMEYAIKMLSVYAKALKQVRDSGVIDEKTYPNGM